MAVSGNIEPSEYLSVPREAMAERFDRPAWLDRPPTTVTLKCDFVRCQDSPAWRPLRSLLDGPVDDAILEPAVTALSNEFRTELAAFRIQSWQTDLARDTDALPSQQARGFPFSVPPTILARHGELAIRTLYCANNLAMAYTSTPIVPATNLDGTSPLSGDTFTNALRDAVLQHFYIALYKHALAQALDHWRLQDALYTRCISAGQLFRTDVLWHMRRDLWLRLEAEHWVVTVLREAFIGRFPKMQDWLWEYCEDTVMRFYGCDPTDAARAARQTGMLRGVASRIARSWARISRLESVTERGLVEEYSRRILALRPRRRAAPYDDEDSEPDVTPGAPPVGPSEAWMARALAFPEDRGY